MDTKKLDTKDDDCIFTSQAPWVQKLMRHCKEPDSWEHITSTIAQRKCIAVTDGSHNLDNKLTTACWIIKGTTSQDRCKGASQTPGMNNDQDATEESFLESIAHYYAYYSSLSNTI